MQKKITFDLYFHWDQIKRMEKFFEFIIKIFLIHVWAFDVDHLEMTWYLDSDYDHIEMT